MKIHGFQKTTLLDYPGQVAATIFFGGCNFRCPFCHNKDLVLYAQESPTISIDEVLSYLKKRQGLLDGVCITGGEPTLQPELETLIRQIKDLGYLVKLDTNGYQPTVLQSLMDNNLLDYVAMDIKNSKKKYGTTTGISNLDIEKIAASVKLLKHGTIPYEFRTTVVKELHTMEDMKEIGRWIAGANAYYLQGYRESENVISPVFSSYSKSELLKIQETLAAYVPNTNLRGVDD